MNTLFLAALLAAALACLATASSKEQDELPPDIEILYDAGQYPQAADALEAALKQDPQDAPLDYWLGRALFEVRDFSPVIASFERAVKIEPDRSEYHEWLAVRVAARPKRTAIPTCPPLFHLRAAPTANSKLQSN